MTVDALESLRQSVMKRYGFGTDEMKKTKVCAFCGAKLSADAKTCTEYGRAVSERTLFDVYKAHHICCAYCDTVLAGNARFCPQCGHKVDKSVQSTAEQIGQMNCNV